MACERSTPRPPSTPGNSLSRIPAISALFVTVIVLSSAYAAQERPLPDAAPLLQRTREHLRDDWRLDHHYSYIERRTEYSRGTDGRDQAKSVKVYEVRPSADGRAYRRLVEVNGRRLTTEELEHNDREHQKRVA